MAIFYVFLSFFIVLYIFVNVILFGGLLPDSTVYLSGEWRVCTPPGLSDGISAGDDRTAYCCVGSYGAPGVKKAAINM